MKIGVLIVTIDGNIGARKTTLLQKFEQSLSSENKVTIKVEHEPVKEFQFLWKWHDKSTGTLLCPTDNAFIFQNYVLDVYQQRMETLETVQHPYRVIVMNCGLDAWHIFTTVNKDQCTKFGFLYLTEMHLWLKSKLFPGKLYATNGVFYLSIDPSEAMKCVTFHNHSGEDQISCDYLILLHQRYNKYLNSVCWLLYFSYSWKWRSRHSWKSTINLCQVYYEKMLIEQIIRWDMLLRYISGIS